MRPAQPILLALALAAFAHPATGEMCPDHPAQVSSDIRSAVDGKVTALKRLLGGGELSVHTEEAVRNLYADYPNADKLMVAQLMLATICRMLESSRLSDKQKLSEYRRTEEAVMRLWVPPKSVVDPAGKRVADSLRQSLVALEVGVDELELATKQARALTWRYSTEASRAVESRSQRALEQALETALQQDSLNRRVFEARERLLLLDRRVTFAMNQAIEWIGNNATAQSLQAVITTMAAIELEVDRLRSKGEFPASSNPWEPSLAPLAALEVEALELKRGVEENDAAAMLRSLPKVPSLTEDYLGSIEAKVVPLFRVQIHAQRSIAADVYRAIDSAHPS